MEYLHFLYKGTVVPFPKGCLKTPFNVTPFTHIMDSVNRSDLKCSLKCSPLNVLSAVTMAILLIRAGPFLGSLQIRAVMWGFFLDSAGPGCGCVCDQYASLHDALLSCSQLPGSLVVTAEHLVLTSLISGKAFGRGDVILPERPSGSTPCGHAVVDFTKPVGQAAATTFISNPPGCTPDPQNSHGEMSYRL